MSALPLERSPLREKGQCIVEDGTDSTKVYGSKPEAIFGQRHVQAFLLFTAMLVTYTTRVNLSVAIIVMVSTDGSAGDHETFDWDSSIRSYALSSFFWGYVFTQIIGGQLTERWGGWLLLLIAVAGSGFFTILNPICASLGGWKGLCAARVAVGFCQGLSPPAVHGIIAKWIPPKERGALGASIYAGSQIGTVFCLLMSGLLSATSAGWPSAFYFFGGLCIAWCVVWFFFGADSPSNHPTISAEEREYIEFNAKTSGSERKPATPWKAMVTSTPVWALLAANCGFVWGYWTLLTGIPSYFDAVFNFSIQKNGFYSSVPYLAMWIMSFPTTLIPNWLLQRGYIRVGTSRMICNTIGYWVPAAALIGVSYVGKEHTALALVIFVIAVGFNAGNYAGYLITHIDMCPNFAATLLGMTNTCGNLCAILAPLVTGFIVTDLTNMSQWRIVFFITSAVYFFTNLWFICFGSWEIQWWNGCSNVDRSSVAKSSEKTNETMEERQS